MNRIYILSAWLVTLIFAIPAAGQVNLGIIGGTNFSTVTGEADDGTSLDFDSRTGFEIGGVLDIGVSKNVSIRFEPMYVRETAKQNIDEVDVRGELIFTANYVEIPALLKLSFGTANVRPFLFAGPSVGFKLNSEGEFSIDGISGKFDFDKLITGTNFMFEFGGGVNIQFQSVSLIAEGRYGLGVTDIFEAGTIPIDPLGQTEFGEADIKTRGLRVMGGITFPVGKQ